MRSVNVIVDVMESKVLQVVAVKEKINNYTVDKTSEFLMVSTSLIGAEDEFISAQTFNFTGKKYVEDVNEDKIHNWIDEQRA